MKWGGFKPLLADAVVAHLEPIQNKYNEVSRANKEVQSGLVSKRHPAPSFMQPTNPPPTPPHNQHPHVGER